MEQPTSSTGPPLPMEMPVLGTPRLVIRPFTIDDLDQVHRLLDDEIETPVAEETQMSLVERRTWLEWTVLNYRQLALLYQPPYGDRAIIYKQNGALIGACGLVPSLGPFCQYPQFRSGEPIIPGEKFTSEVGLYYAISPRFRRQGFASEAAGALIAFAFQQLNLKRIVATTTRANRASIGVMQKLGMRVEENPFPDPPWSQVVGMLNNPHK